MRAPDADASAGEGATVVVEAPARLHFGMLDLRGSLGRRFGGMGAAVREPALLLEAAPARALRADGPDAERALAFARRFLEWHGLAAGARLHVRRTIPAHAGLGSGTQLALAVARALAELHGVPHDAPSLARAVGRARRSAVGTWAFAFGGFTLEGGRRDDGDAPAPLLAHLPFPDDWRYVIAAPRAAPSVSGDAEAAAFARLPPPPEREVERVAHLVLMGLLPALAEGDLETFGAALTEVQRVTGGWFAAAQGGAFAPGATEALVRGMREWGAAGVGQSSWGPAAYGLVAGDDAAAALAARVRSALGTDGAVYTGAFAREGARVWRRGG